MGLAAILELTVDSHSNAVCNQRAHLAEIQMDVSGTSVYLGSAQISDVKHGLKGKSLSSYYILLNQKTARRRHALLETNIRPIQDLQ